jgi:hypothetical protein
VNTNITLVWKEKPHKILTLLLLQAWLESKPASLHNGTQFLSHLMKSHDLGIIQLELWLGKGRNLLKVGTVTSNIARIKENLAQRISITLRKLNTRLLYHW